MGRAGRGFTGARVLRRAPADGGPVARRRTRFSAARFASWMFDVFRSGEDDGFGEWMSRRRRTFSTPAAPIRTAPARESLGNLSSRSSPDSAASARPMRISGSAQRIRRSSPNGPWRTSATGAWPALPKLPAEVPRPHRVGRLWRSSSASVAPPRYRSSDNGAREEWIDRVRAAGRARPL
jgi:hypothetical protein